MMICHARLKEPIAILLLVLPVVAAQAGTIALVPVGNPGNANDTHGDGYGGVGYVYSIGTYEVTAGQYCEFLNAVAATDQYDLYLSWMADPSFGCKIERSGSSGSYSYSVATEWADHPVNNVSWGDAARFANWLHNGQPTGPQSLSTTEDGAYYLNGATSYAALLAVSRELDWKWAIPTENEWYKAAYHKNDGVTGNYFDYPTGSDTMPSNDLIDPDPGNNATFFDSDTTVSGPDYRTPVGAHENSDSPYGTFDQAGNVAEWNETPIGVAAYGVLGGGYGSYYALKAGSRSGEFAPDSHSPGVGFRVVSSALVPEPGILVLLISGAVAGLIGWRRRK